MLSESLLLSFLVLISLSSRLSVSILLKKRGPERSLFHWILGETVGICQDGSLIFVQWMLLNLLPFLNLGNSPFVPLLSGCLIAGIGLYPLLDAFLFFSFQLRMRISYFRYLAWAKSFWHSAFQMSVLWFVLLLGALFLVLLYGSYSVREALPFGVEGILLFFVFSGIGLLGLKARWSSVLSDFYNPWFRDLSRMFADPFSGKAKGLNDIQKLISPAERYEMLTEEFPLLRMTHGFQGTPRLKVNIKEKEKPHIVLVSIESFRTKDLGMMGNPHKPSPRFDQLAKEGFFFSNFHASGIPTARSLIGTLFGIYPKLHADMLFESNPTYPLIGIPHLLKETGYRTSYLQSGDLFFQNYHSFLESHGFEDIFGDDQILEKFPDASGTSWGVDDEHVFKYAASYLSRATAKGQPTFLTILTGTNHHPWKVPENFTPPDFALPKDSLYRRYLGTYYYSDWALGQFIDALKKEGIAEQTVFFITSDTGQPMGEHSGNFMLFNGLYSEHEHVPLLILAEGRIAKPEIVDEPASQIDLLPTVMDMLQLKGVNHSLGTSLLRIIPERTLFTANPHAEIFARAIRGNKRFTINFGSKLCELFDLSKDPAELHDKSHENPKDTKAFEREVKSFFSGINQLYDAGKICMEASGSVFYHPDPNLTDEGLITDLRQRKEISMISITGCPKLSDKGIASLAGSAKHLKILQLSKLLITEVSLEALRKGSSDLRSFKLSYCPHVKSEGVERFVKKLPALVEVDFSGLSQIEGAVLAGLAEGSPALTSLILNSCIKITDYSLDVLSKKCPGLKHLDLQGCFNVDDDTLKILADGAFQLRKLSLLDCPNYTEEGFLALIKKQRALKELSATAAYLSDASVNLLVREVKNLYKICLNDCEELTLPSFLSLAKRYSGLEAIGLSHCPHLSDDFLKALEKHPLHHFFLVDCPNISDEGVSSLFSLPLRNLCILNCPNISPKKMLELKRHFQRHSTVVNILTDLDIDDEGLLA